MAPSPDSTPEFDHRLVKVLEHPVRIGFLTLLAKRSPLTPAEALDHLQGENLLLSVVTYHVRVLHQFGLVEAMGRPGSAESLSFRATPAGESALLALGYMPRGDDA
jgi:predicted transcriptional regulator